VLVIIENMYLRSTEDRKLLLQISTVCVRKPTDNGHVSVILGPIYWAYSSSSMGGVCRLSSLEGKFFPLGTAYWTDMVAMPDV
jgi:hypothetical protein